MPLLRPLHVRRVALLAALLATTACLDKEPTAEPPPLGGLTVTTSTNKDTLVTGDTALVTFTFSNPTATAMTFESGTVSSTGAVPCPALLPVAAYPNNDDLVYAFILSPCFGGVDTTLTGSLGLQRVVVPANGSVSRTIPFTGITRPNSASAARCLPPGRQWVLPLFFIDGELAPPTGTRDIDGPALIFLKPPTATPVPCTPL